MASWPPYTSKTMLITASEKIILFTKWVGQGAFSQLIVRSFKKCGVSVAVDGSVDSEINISGLEDYKVGKSKDKATDDDIDPFEDMD